ncbi:MAG: PD40 domain-containing protein [Phycisphaerales bacterium]|nr:PD40 domain-containing protein [Phycisphaerales bacterium]
MKRFGVWIVLGVAALALVAGASLLWYTTPRSVGVLTDGDTIRLDAGGRDPSRPILWQPAAPLPSLVNSGRPEYEPRFSEDGNTLFFVRGKAGGNADIYESTRTFDGWSEPRPVDAVNTGADELGPCPSLDGRDLYFYSNRPGGQGGYDLWVSHRQDGEWLAPTNLGSAVNSSLNDYGPAVSPDGKRVYFASNRPRPSEEGPNQEAWSATLREQLYQHDYDIYATTLGADGASAAEPVPALNSPRDEGAPCVAPFGDFVYFASDREGGLGGLDLYRARLREGVPGVPENLGSAVNSSGNDLDPALTMGGFAIYFSSDRDLPAELEGARDTPLPQEAGGAPARHDYNLFRSFSREIYRDSRMARRAVNWPAIGNALLLLVLLALLGLLLWMIARARASDRFHKLGLFAKCILASLLIHSLLLLLLAFWQVGSAIQGLLQHSSGTRVALTSGHGSDALTTQVRGGLTEVSITTSAPAPEAAQIPGAMPTVDTARLTSTEINLAARPEAPRTANDSRPAVEGPTRTAEAPGTVAQSVKAPDAPSPESVREVAAAVGVVARADATPRAIERADLRHADAAAVAAPDTHTAPAPLQSAASPPPSDASAPGAPHAAPAEVATTAPAEVGVTTPAPAGAVRASEPGAAVAAVGAAQSDRPALAGAPAQERAAITPAGAAPAATPLAAAQASDTPSANVAELGATDAGRATPAAGAPALTVDTPATASPAPATEASASVATRSGGAANTERPAAPVSAAQGEVSVAALAAPRAATDTPTATLARPVASDVTAPGSESSLTSAAKSVPSTAAGVATTTPAAPAQTVAAEQPTIVRTAAPSAGDARGRPETPRASQGLSPDMVSMNTGRVESGVPAASMATAQTDDARTAGTRVNAAPTAGPSAVPAPVSGVASPKPSTAAAVAELASVVRAASQEASDARGRPDAPRASDSKSPELALVPIEPVAGTTPVSVAAATAGDVQNGSVPGSATVVAAPNAAPTLGNLASPRASAAPESAEPSPVVRVAADGAGARSTNPTAPASSAGTATTLASLSPADVRTVATVMPSPVESAVEVTEPSPSSADGSVDVTPAPVPGTGVAAPPSSRAPGASEVGLSVAIPRAAAGTARPGTAGASPGAGVAVLPAPRAPTAPPGALESARAVDAPVSVAALDSAAAAPRTAGVHATPGIVVAAPASAGPLPPGSEADIHGSLRAADADFGARPVAPASDSGTGSVYGIAAERTRTSAQAVDAPASPGDAPDDRALGPAVPNAPPASSGAGIALAQPLSGNRAAARAAGEAAARVDAAPAAGSLAPRLSDTAPASWSAARASVVEPGRAVLAAAATIGTEEARDSTAAASRATGPVQRASPDLPHPPALAVPNDAGGIAPQRTASREVEAPTLLLAAPAAGVRSTTPAPAASARGPERVALAPESSVSSPVSRPLGRFLAAPDAASVAALGFRRDGDVAMDVAPAMAIPLPGPDAAAIPNPRGTLSGVVLDASNSEPLVGATVRLDMPSGDPVIVQSGEGGRYMLEASGLPDHVAVSASHEGYTPDSASIASDDLLAGARHTFRLAPTERGTIALEGDPEVHHLGNDEFEGRINSQFQKPSEGLVYEAVFRLSADQAPPNVSRAEIVMLVRGAQAPNEIRINGWLLDQRIDESPDDGSFGEFRAAIPVQALVRGDNAITIRSRRGSSDLDDFEFVNVRVRLARPASRVE